MEAYESINHKGFIIKIYHDEDAQNPRDDWDNFGEMICWHRRYNLGDKHDYKSSSSFFETLTYKLELTEEEEQNIIDNENWLKTVEIAETQGHIIKPLYLYDHSGITMSLSSFSCSWDSGCVGFYYLSPEKIKKEYGENPDKSLIEGRIEGEVNIYDEYLRGNVFGFMAYDKKGNEIDSCWGYYGTNFDENGLKETAISSIEYNIKKELKVKLNKIKTFIRNNVPLIIRQKLITDY